MPTPDSVETILARLTPAAMSVNGQRGIEAMIDELVGESPVAVQVPQPPAANRLRWPLGIAAAAVLGIWWLAETPTQGPLHAGNTVQAADGGDFTLLDGSGRIESVTEAGWHEDSDGSVMRAVRLNVVEENRLLDGETGIVMTVREPREEILLMPVSAF